MLLVMDNVSGNDSYIIANKHGDRYLMSYSCVSIRDPLVRMEILVKLDPRDQK